MNKHRLVSTAFWDDAYIMKLDPSEKLLFMYLLTNPLTNICGVYQIELKRIAFDTGFDSEVVREVLERLEKDGKCLYRDGWLAMRNWIKHQNPSSKVKEGIEIQLKAVPKIMLEYVKCDTVPISYPYSMDTQSHLNPNSNSNLNPNSNTKEEQPVSTPAGRALSTKAPPVIYNFSESMWYGITDEQVSLWSEAYPAVDVDMELRQMGEWCKTNGAKGHKTNYSRFIVNWLKRSQDRGGSMQKGRKR